MKQLFPKIMLVVGGFFAVTLVAIVAFVYVSESQQIEREGLVRAETLNRMAFEALYTSMRGGGGRDGNRQVIARLRELGAFTKLRVAKGEPVIRQFGAEPDELPQDELERQALSGEAMQQIRWEDGYRVVRYVTPLRVRAECQRCHQVEIGAINGVISTEISLREYEHALGQRRDMLLLAVGSDLLALGLITFYSLRRLVIRPLQAIQHGAVAIAHGDLSHRLEVRTGDELEILAKEFNRMAAQLQDSYASLDQKMAERTQQSRRLSALNAIAATVSQSLDLDETLNDALDKVLDVAGVDGAGIYLVEGDRLFLKVYRNLPPHFVEAVSELRVGEGLSGRVAEFGQPIVVQEGLSQDPRLSSEIVRQQGFESFACVPLLSKGKVVGVLPMATYRRREFSAEDLELLIAVGSQIGVAVENARLHAQVQQQASYLNTLIESSGNAIIMIDREGKIVSWNRAAEIIYGWSKEEAIGQIIPMVPEYEREESLRGIARMMESGGTIYNLETQRLRKNGELIPVMVTGSPIRDAHGKIIGILGISTDMRDKKRLEQELLRQQRALAVLEERERLARELHDSLGQIVGYVNTQTQAARELLSRGQTAAADAHLRRLVEVAQDAHADVREYILSLRAGALTEQGFLPALKEYLQRFSQNNGIQAELTASEALADVQFGPDVEAQLMRIIQEALTNVQKHAHAQHVWVTLEANNGQAQVAIKDDGRGFEPAYISPEERWHFGLRIMRERAEEIGGSIEVQALPGQGTKVTVKAPLSRERGN